MKTHSTDQKGPRTGLRAGLRMAPLLKRFARNDQATIAVMFAIMLPIILGVAGLGVEAGMWFKDRRELQTIADAAVISAAIENSYGASSSEYTAAATVEANLNGFNDSTDSFTSVGTPTSGAYSGDSDYIEVVLSRNLTTIISQVFYNFDPVTTARAVATTTGDSEACVLALSTTASPAVDISGNGTVSMVDCGLVSNSTQSAYSVEVCNNCDLTTDCVWAAGGIDDGLNSITTTNCTDPVSNASPVSDPYATLDVPADFGDCDPATSMSGGQYIINSDTTLDPGRYCQGFAITNGTVTMNPGTYIMDSGDFNMTGGNLTGEGVTFILSSSTSPANDTGEMKITGNGTVDLTAPTSGAYTGILMYQDRNVSGAPNARHLLTGGSTAELSGVLYAPNYNIDFAGGNDTSSAGCVMIIAQEVGFSGNADLENDCSTYGVNPILYGASPRLVE